jgi:hypothetical protein
LLTDDDALIPGTDGAMVVDTTHPASIDLPSIAADLSRLLWPHTALVDNDQINPGLSGIPRR